MNKTSSAYIVGFAALICIVCSLILSVVSGSLAEQQQKNRVVDQQKNILLATGITPKMLGKMSSEDVTKTYGTKIKEMVIGRDGKIVEGKTIANLDKKVAVGEDINAEFLPIYQEMNDKGEAASFIYPVTGKGLWSTLYGYLAVRPNGDDVVGIAFYKHGETPGLGAEIEKSWFTENFKGKKLYSDGKFVGVEVVKGKVADKVGIDIAHAVDGISGATITGNGVGKMMQKKPKLYEPFFKNNMAVKGASL